MGSIDSGWPIADLLDAARREQVTPLQIRRAVNANASHWEALVTGRRMLSDEMAEHLAIHLLGLHPCNVWIDWCDEVPGVQLDLFDAPTDAFTINERLAA